MEGRCIYRRRRAFLGSIYLVLVAEASQYFEARRIVLQVAMIPE